MAEKKKPVTVNISFNSQYDAELLAELDKIRLTYRGGVSAYIRAMLYRALKLNKKGSKNGD